MLRCTCCGQWTVEQIWLQKPAWRHARRVLRLLNGATLVGDGYYTSASQVATVLAWHGILHRMVDVEGSQADIPRPMDCPGR